jgi:septal ring factor EnvC (AmiA/AmiB activator)
MQHKTLERILEVIQRYTLIGSINDVQLKCRKQEIVVSRQLACYFLKKFTHLSDKKIGQLLRGLDRTTVIHSIKVIDNCLEINQDPIYKDRNFRERINEMEREVIDILTPKTQNHDRYKTREQYKSELAVQDKMIIDLKRQIYELENTIKMYRARIYRLEKNCKTIA